MSVGGAEKLGWLWGSLTAAGLAGVAVIVVMVLRHDATRFTRADGDALRRELTEMNGKINERMTVIERHAQWMHGGFDPAAGNIPPVPIPPSTSDNPYDLTQHQLE